MIPRLQYRDCTAVLCTVQYSTVKYSTVKYSAVQYVHVQSSTSSTLLCTYLLRPLTMWRGTGYPVPRLLCFCQTDLLLCAISTRIPSKIPFFSVKPRRNRRSRRGKKNLPPVFSTFFTERASYYVHFWHYSTVRYCCKPIMQYIFCTVQYCIWWMLHCKKSPFI